jgi:hypothetical protein
MPVRSPARPGPRPAFSRGSTRSAEATGSLRWAVRRAPGSVHCAPTVNHPRPPAGASPRPPPRADHPDSGSAPARNARPPAVPHRPRALVAVLVAVHYRPGHAGQVRAPGHGLPRLLIRGFWVRVPGAPRVLTWLFAAQEAHGAGMGRGWPGYGRCAGHGCCRASVACWRPR